MTIRAFISVATERDDSNAPLPLQFRQRVKDALRHPAIHCIVQEWLEADGNNPLVMLAEIIRHNCDVLIQVISDQIGQVPPRDHADELIRHVDRTGTSALKTRFPCLFETWPTCTSEVWQHLTYTQWEAWLAKYYEKKVVLFRFQGTQQPLDVNRVINTWSEYLRIADRYFQLHSTHSSFDKLVIAMHRFLLSISGRQTSKDSQVTWVHPSNVPVNSLANRFDELNLFDRIISPTSNRRILFLSGKSNIGKTTLLNAFQFKCKELRHVRPIAADCKGGVSFDDIVRKLSTDLSRTGSPNIQWDFLTESIRSEDTNLFSYLREYALKERPIVVFLDTYEDASRDCIQWVEQSLLPFIANNENVAAVIAGQSTPTYNKLWSDSTYFHAVEPITIPAEWCRFRDRNKVIGMSDEKIRELVAWADGDPGFLGPVILQSNRGGM